MQEKFEGEIIVISWFTSRSVLQSSTTILNQLPCQLVCTRIRTLGYEFTIAMTVSYIYIA